MTTRSRLVAVLGSSIVVASVACSSFGTDPGPVQSPTNDAAIPTDSPPTPADGGLLGDGDASALRFCERAAHTRCADFDGPNIGEWADPENDANNTDGVGGGEIAFPPEGNENVGLRTTLPAGTASGKVARELRLDDIHDVVVEADVRVNGIEDGLSVTILGVLFGAGDGTPAVELKVESTNGVVQIVMYLRASPTSDLFQLIVSAAAFPVNAWVHVVLEAGTAGSGQGFGRVKIPSLAVDSSFAINRGPALGATLKTRVLVGLQRYGQNAQQPTVATYDNVTAEILGGE